MTTRPTADIVPTWRGQLIPDVWEAVRFGLEKERKRLTGHRFVTAVLQRSLDYDGLTEWIYLGRAFNDSDSAQQHVAEELEKCVALYVRARNEADRPWHQLDEPTHVRWPDSSLWPAHGPVVRVKWGDGSGFNSEDFHGAAFGVNPDEPLTDTLLAAMGQETEFVRYFQGVAHSR